MKKSVEVSRYPPGYRSTVGGYVQGTLRILLFPSLSKFSTLVIVYPELQYSELCLFLLLVLVNLTAEDRPARPGMSKRHSVRTHAYILPAIHSNNACRSALWSAATTVGKSSSALEL